MKNRVLAELVSATLLAVLAGAVGYADELPVVRWQGRTMGSPYLVQIVGTNLTPAQVQTLQAEVEARLKEVNRQMSHYQSDSELSQFNRAPANRPFKVSAEFASVVRFSLEVARRSGGAFDPTLAPVINLWGFGEKTNSPAVPTEAELKAALAKTGWQHLTVTDRDELVKDIPDLTVNLSAVAKGFGVDEMVRVLRSRDLTNVYAAIAGDVMVLGHNAYGRNWQVGISTPVAHWNETDPMAAVVSLSHQAVSTAGDYQKFFTDSQGRRFSHIMDPRTGWPVRNQLGGVSVVAESSMMADALDTTAYVLGLEAGLKFIESWTNAAALFIVREAEGRERQIPSSRFESRTGYHAPKELLSIPTVPR